MNKKQKLDNNLTAIKHFYWIEIGIQRNIVFLQSINGKQEKLRQFVNFVIKTHTVITFKQTVFSALIFEFNNYTVNIG